MKRFIAVLLLSSLVFGQSEEEMPTKVHLDKPPKDVNSQIRAIEHSKKSDVGLEKTNFEQLNFLIGKYSEFILKPKSDEVIRATVDIFWKQNNVYLLANMQQYEEVQIHVYSGNQRKVEFKDSFYTATGFKIEGKANKTYRIVLKTKGTYEKMAVLRISQKIQMPKEAAKKGSMQQAEQKLFTAVTKLQNSLSYAKSGFLLDEQITTYVMHQSHAYGMFQLFESVLIVLISCVQVLFLTRMLKSDIVV